MRTSDDIKDIAKALATAQASMKNAPLNKVNPHFKSKYADLAGIRDAVTPSLSACGISVSQTIDHREAGVYVVTRLIHSSGQWLESACPIPLGKMQELGSAITYARRYSLSAICGIAADEDDDANSVTEAQKIFDEVGYQEWLTNLETSAKNGTYAELLTTVKAGKQDFQDALRADKKTWLKLKALTEVPA
jgi:hypothetical protein